MKFKVARIELELTQAQLGELVGLSQEQISAVEGGWLPPPDMRPRLAQALGKPEDVLFEEVSEVTR